MILILSQSKYEYSTVKIIDWLVKLGGDFLRINGEDLIESRNLKISIDNKDFVINDRNLQKLNVKVVFNRRWLDHESIIYHPNVAEEKTFANQYKLVQSLKNEFVCISQYMFRQYKNAVWIPEHKNINKLEVLATAANVGLKIPQTNIFTTKVDVLSFLKKTKIITKSISDINTLGSASQIRSYLTKELNMNEVNSLSDTFPPSLFQEKVEKEFEIRTFYFFRKCYSVAIFSQYDDKTSVDFRNYNYEKPNRKEPYLLPKLIESKLILLMEEIGLNTGSIDIIKTTSGEYVFLEVNPVGQFGMTEEPGNYNLHKIIAQKLIEIDEEK